jgi:hypothetical protein
VIDDEHVAVWIKGGRNLGTVQHLRTFFNDAATVPAGRLVDRNPFAKLDCAAAAADGTRCRPGQLEIANRRISGC